MYIKEPFAILLIIEQIFNKALKQKFNKKTNRFTCS